MVGLRVRGNEGEGKRKEGVKLGTWNWERRTKNEKRRAKSEERRMKNQWCGRVYW
jgi:hypothetical protein